MRFSSAFVLAFAPVLLARMSAANPQSGVVGWGIARFDSHWSEEPFVSVGAGTQITVALRANGTLAAWGLNHDGQCEVPDPPAGLSYTKVSAGLAHVLARLSNGTVVAWGLNAQGQCNVPALPAGLHYSAVAAGFDFSLALRSDGTLVGWGSNVYGQCNVPVAPAGTVFTAIAAGATHGEALRSDGVAVAWGGNYAPLHVVPTLPAGMTYLEIAASQYFGLARRSDGHAIVWGLPQHGEDAVPGLPSGMSYVSVAAGRNHALALRSDGALLAWGDNTSGQCDVPAPPPGLTYVAISGGADHSVARRSDGIAVCWGNTTSFQCNVPTLPAGVSFVQGAMNTWVSDVDPAGPDALVGLRTDGQIFTSWDHTSSSVPPLPPGMSYTQLGPGVTGAAIRSDGALIPFQSGLIVPTLPPGVRFVGLAAGSSIYYLSCGFGYWDGSGGTFACLSDGTMLLFSSHCPYFSCSPNPLPPGLTYDQVCASGVHTLARRSDGSVVGWGDTTYGECTAPPLPPGVTYVDIAAGGGTYFETNCTSLTYVDPAHSLGLRSDGLLVGWGAGPGGLSAPPPGVSYVQIASGEQFNVARRSDGSVVAWGDNSFGQCNVPSPRPGESYTGIAAGAYSAVAFYSPAPACGSVSTYCYPAKPNSASAQGAQLTSEGCPGLTANNLVLDVSGLPPSKVGMFLYSSAQQQVSFGNGWGCVAGGIQRVLPAILSSPTGTVSYPVDLTQFPYTGSAHSILAGSAWNFQFWYRDPTAPPSQFNLSDALHISFAQ